MNKPYKKSGIDLTRVECKDNSDTNEWSSNMRIDLTRVECKEIVCQIIVWIRSV